MLAEADVHDASLALRDGQLARSTDVLYEHEHDPNSIHVGMQLLSKQTERVQQVLDSLLHAMLP